MIKLYNNKDNILTEKGEQDIVVNLSEENDTIFFSLYSNEKKIMEKTILVSELKNGRTNLIIKSTAFLYDGDSPEENEEYILTNDNGFMYMVENISAIFDSKSAPTIQIYKNNDLIIIRTNMKTYCKTLEQIESNAGFSSIIAENDPSYNNNLRSEKKSLRQWTDPRTSLAYIEVQLDIITQMIFVMLDANKTLSTKVNDKIEYLEQFRKIVEELYVTNIKSTESCLNELTENKAKIRQLQSDYYALKNNDSN